ncbi:MAG TPA: hypothetical protein VJM31_00030 [Vicinamibacterales bacterium]|nr:hypothetical protein [Vicinamibacterales bacterium]
MTLYSKADLRNQALREIGVLDHGEQPDADMVSVVDPIAQQLLEYLNDENVLAFDSSVSVSTQVIPGRLMGGLVDVLKWRIAPTYSRPREVKTVGEAMHTLRRSILEGQNDIPVSVDYF